MTIVLTAPDLYHGSLVDYYCVFLAGAIDMGAAVDWQAEVIERLQGYDKLMLFNPRRKDFTPDTLDEQIKWELNFLDIANTVFMWLPANSKAPISLFEAGLYWQSGKLCIGADAGFYRRHNLELTGKRYGVYIYKTLDETIEALSLDIRRKPL